MSRTLRLGTGLALAGAAAVGCLPGDERPTPGSIEVTVESTAATRAPFATADGWTVTIARFVTAVGDVRLQGRQGSGEDDGTCNDYAETRYERLFDFVAVDEREKVGLVYGLGTCNVAVRLQPPSDDPLIGTGATESDVARMRLRGSDDYADDERTSLFLQGSAIQEGRTLTFEWVFRRSYTLDRCPATSRDTPISQVELDGGESRRLGVEIRAEELFRRAPSDQSPLQFDLFAEADEVGDANGDVTLEELAAVEAPTDELLFDEDLEPADDMEQLLYEQLYLRVLRVVGGEACDIEVRDGRGPGRR